MVGENGVPETPDWQPEPHPWDETSYLAASETNRARLAASIERLEAHIERGTN